MKQKISYQFTLSDEYVPFKALREDIFFTIIHIF